MRIIYFLLTLLIFGCDPIFTDDGTKTGSDTGLQIPGLELTPEDFVNETPVRYGAVAMVGAPLDTGTYTFYFKDCAYDRQLYTTLQLDLYETLTENIHFEKGESWESSDMRIICSDRYGWVSYTGMDIFKLPPDQWTTSIGKEYSPQYVEYATKHELWGHAINGMDHEQHNSRDGINWDTLNLYKYFHDNYKWDTTTVHKWLTRDRRLNLQGTDFDKESFMLYYYPCNLVVDSVGCGIMNYIPSETDFKFFYKNHGRAS